jgi:hypothetical protein
VTSGNKPGLLGKIHFDVKYDMTLDLLIPSKLGHLVGSHLLRGRPIGRDVQDLSFAHFLLNCICPVGVPILLIKLKDLLYGLRDSYPVLVSCPPVLLLDLINHTVTLS